MTETPNAGNQKSVKAAEKRERRTRQQELADLTYVLSTSKGRRLIWRLMETCGVHEISYVRGDTHHTAFLEGQRNVGNKLLADVMDCEASLYQLMREENTEEEQEDARSGEARGTSDASTSGSDSNS